MEIVYVTVGTTKFESLIEEVTSPSALETLKNRGCRQLILQLGNGKPVDAEAIKKQFQIDVIQYDFKFEPIRMDIKNSNLTIGHAGAGTCMDILHLQKPGLLVTNEDLMGNHQLELAEKMSEDGYIFQCSLKELVKNLKTIKLEDLKPYEHSKNMSKFVNSLNNLMCQ